MNALVRIVLLVLIAFLMLVNLILLGSESTSPIEKLALAVPAVLLSGRRFASAVALADIHDGPPVVPAVVCRPRTAAGGGRPQGRP
jgi:hypothetical protein